MSNCAVSLNRDSVAFGQKGLTMIEGSEEVHLIVASILCQFWPQEISLTKNSTNFNFHHQRSLCLRTAQTESEAPAHLSSEHHRGKTYFSLA